MDKQSAVYRKRVPQRYPKEVEGANEANTRGLVAGEIKATVSCETREEQNVGNLYRNIWKRLARYRRCRM